MFCIFVCHTTPLSKNNISNSTSNNSQRASIVTREMAQLNLDIKITLKSGLKPISDCAMTVLKTLLSPKGQNLIIEDLL